MSNSNFLHNRISASYLYCPWSGGVAECGILGDIQYCTDCRMVLDGSIENQQNTFVTKQGNLYYYPRNLSDCIDSRSTDTLGLHSRGAKGSTTSGRNRLRGAP